MFKLFVTINNLDKILKRFDYQNDNAFKSEKLFEYLGQICFNLDIPVPIILKSHTQHLKKFNHTKFTKSDFVESVPFTHLTLQKYEE